MIWFLLIAGALVVAIFLAILFQENPANEVIDDYFNKVYKDEPDWSLMVKGYPVVNDVDIQYSEWLAANPGKVV